MVGSITAACVLFSLSRSLCVLRRRRVFKLVFSTLALVFLCLVFARALNDGLNGTETDETTFPLRGELM